MNFKSLLPLSSFVVFYFLTTNYLIAQTTIVNFERRANIEYQLRNVKDPARRAMVSKVLSKPRLFKLINSNNLSSFRQVNDDGLSNDINVINESISNQTFKDLEEEIYYKESILEGKNFIIQDTLSNNIWKITEETKVVAGYNCNKAMANVNGEEVIAWITKELRLDDGPDFYRIKDGLILELELKATSYVATSISTTDKSVKLSKPEKGEIISQKEYDKKLSKFMSRFIMKD